MKRKNRMQRKRPNDKRRSKLRKLRKKSPESWNGELRKKKSAKNKKST